MARDGGKHTLLERAGALAANLGRGQAAGRRRLFIQWGLALGIFGALVAVLISQWGKLPDYDWRFRPGWLAVAVAAVAALYVAQAELWRLIVRGLGGGDMPHAASRSVWAKSLVARYVPTNVLLVVGRVVLAERLGVPRRVTLASIVYEVGLAVCAAVIVGSYFVIELPGLEDQPARYAILVLVPLALGALHPRMFEPITRWGLGKLGREPLPRVLPFGSVLRLALAYALTWVSMGLGVYCFASAVHPIDAGDLAYIVASYPVSFCVAVLTFIVPSGLGTRDATLVAALDVVLPGSVALAIGVAFRIFQVLVELAYVGVVVLLGRGTMPRGVEPASP